MNIYRNGKSNGASFLFLRLCSNVSIMLSCGRRKRAVQSQEDPRTVVTVRKYNPCLSWPQLLHVSVTFKFVTWNRSEANECGCWFAVYYVCLYGKLIAMFEFKTDQYWSIPRGIWKTVRSSCFQWRRLFSPPEPGLEILLQVQTKRKSVGAALKGALKFPQWKIVYHYNVKMKETLGH